MTVCKTHLDILEGIGKFSQFLFQPSVHRGENDVNQVNKIFTSQQHQKYI